ncbi:MAG: endonuclease/exonuclease/phosphatase family protein [Myxococcales bacterium]|nr:endonuclease/exonuclease/phosphatase family protein [Myxococcales bacterium]MCB9700471.1 endonuclease/exonuclease/phosphatase family protein [Myxococcales bacterium]
MRLASALGMILVLGTGISSVLGLAAWLWPDAWVLDLFNHFRGQALVALALAAGLLLVARRRRWALAALALAALDLARVAPLYLPGPEADAGPRLRLVHFNVLSSNRERDAVADFLARQDADVILLQEVDPRWAATARALPGYEVAALLPRADNFGIAALVRAGRPFEATIRELGGGLPAIDLEVDLGARRLAILSVHTLPPVSAAYAGRRDQMIAEAAAWASARRAEGRTPVVIGDLNATPFSVAFPPLAAAGLVSSQRGFGLQPSWPTAPWYLRALAIPIDHCLHDPALATAAREVGPVLGSDHRPLLVDLGEAAR